MHRSGVSRSQSLLVILLAGLLHTPRMVSAAGVGLEPSASLGRCGGPPIALAASIREIASLQGYQADLTLDESVLSLPDSPPYGFAPGDFLGAEAAFFIQRFAEGIYRVTHVKLGPPGVSGSGSLFTLSGDPIGETQVEMQVALSSFIGRDHLNQPIGIDVDPPAIVRVDCTRPLASIEEIDRSCFRGVAAEDPIEATVAATDAGGVGADLDRIEWQYVPGESDCNPAGSWTTLADSLTGVMYGPAPHTFSDPPAAGSWTLAVRAVDDAGNRSACALLALRFLPDLPPAIADLTAETLHRRISLRWTPPTLLPGQEIWIVRKSWFADGSSGYPVYPLGGSLAGGAYPSSPSDGVVVHRTSSGSEFVDDVGVAATTPDVYLYRAFTVDCLDAANAGEGPAGIGQDFEEEILEDAVDAASNYWLSDMDDLIGLPYQQDGYVTAVDLSVLSGGFGLVSGQPGFIPEADFGPSAMPTGSPTGVPRPDREINFEDLIILAINYGAVAPMREDPVILGPGSVSHGTPRIALRTLRTSGNPHPLVRADLRVEGSAEALRGVRAVVVYDPQAWSYEGYEEGPGLRARPDATFHHVSNRAGGVDLCAVVLGRRGRFSGAGTLVGLFFRARHASPPALRIGETWLRDHDNRPIRPGAPSPSERTETAAAASRGPTALQRWDAAPNPSLGTTSIRLSLGLEVEIEVAIYDVRGQRVRSLARGLLPPGEMQIEWDGTDEASRPVEAGIYFCQIKAGSETLRKKIALLR